MAHTHAQPSPVFELLSKPSYSFAHVLELLAICKGCFGGHVVYVIEKLRHAIIDRRQFILNRFIWVLIIMPTSFNHPSLHAAKWAQPIILFPAVMVNLNSHLGTTPGTSPGSSCVR